MIESENITESSLPSILYINKLLGKKYDDDNLKGEHSSPYKDDYDNGYNYSRGSSHDHGYDGHGYTFDFGSSCYDIQHISSDINYDIFLSHSYLDKLQVFALIRLFNRNGFSVYVDWIEDKQLDRNSVNTKTVDLLRYRMKQSKCLLYLTTSNIANSKWCPWELGYFDGLKQSKCCILPIIEHENTFNGQEYLGLYPYLEYASLTGIDAECSFYVCAQNRTKFIKLQSWINNSTKFHQGTLI